MSNPWGKMGSWADRADEEDREAAAAAAAAAAASASTDADSLNFPSLKESASAKPKKKKHMTLSLSAFQKTENQGLTLNETLLLPTAPKQRSDEEIQQSRYGRGFSSYEQSSRGRDSGDNSWGGGRRTYGGGFDEDRRGGPSYRVSEFDQPSRADESDNWGMGKKSFDSSRASRAHETNNWAMEKRQQQPLPSRSSTFGSGFHASGPGPDRWTREGPLDERPRLVLDPPKHDRLVIEPVKSNKPNPFGAARPREEVLAEKGVDFKKLESEMDANKMSRPTSSQSSRPSSVHSSRSELETETAVKSKPKVNPFGDAKPREVVLEEKGLDWRKIDIQMERPHADRPETDEEKAMKEEIERMKRELDRELEMKSNDQSAQGPDEDKSNLSDIISEKEGELEALTRDLDDKIRFRQRTSQRPGSGSSRHADSYDRPRSRLGLVDEPRGMDYNDRPHLRGQGRYSQEEHNSDRRAFQGGKSRGFFGNRDLDRSRSRDRW
ncbi:hypothetical protein SAY87_020344 [Trapa incisa]|uniref:Uncharacterized protein n=1 Tax=Trapa incisa TaxID=236973 RepID=A0AAN7K0L5_9MYRT|nr:hypothetical protein SAY87_020344 [Trapa incisa]